MSKHGWGIISTYHATSQDLVLYRKFSEDAFELIGLIRFGHTQGSATQCVIHFFGVEPLKPNDIL